MKHLILAALAATSPYATVLAQPMTLDDALRIGEGQSPRLSAQRFAVVAAGEQVARSTELPDPRVRFGIENLPVTGPDQFRYDRDFMTSRALGFTQEFPNQEKRSARGERAQQLRDVEQAMLESQRAMLRRDIATAWFDVHFAERSKQTLERLVGQLAMQAELSSPAVLRGRQGAADTLVLRSAAEQARDRVLDTERGILRARYTLAAVIGDEGSRNPLAASPDVARLQTSREALLERLHEHPHLRVYDVKQHLAKADVDVARATRNSDWSLEVGYSHRKPTFDNMVTIMVAFDLPWQRERRQERDIASKLAEFEQSRALREEARRVHEAELRSWLADYDAASARIDRYRAVLMPLTRDRHDAALAAYRGRRGELNPVLEAARAITDTELALIAVEAERARAWAQLSYLYPHEAHR